MKINVRGVILEATVTQENGAARGHGDPVAILEALGVPVLRRRWRTPLVALGALAEALSLPRGYEAATNTYHLGALPPLPLPADPVGGNTDPWQPVTAPICSGPGGRSAELLERVIKQFQVAVNPALLPRDGNTYCNIFVWWVTLALGAEIPHWVDDAGRPRPVGVGHELDANGVVGWLHKRGSDYGWHAVWDDLRALGAANQGKPAVAVWLNPGGIGHVAMVRPGERIPRRGVPIAQAGSTNFDDGYLVDGFGQYAGQVGFYVHD